MRRCISTDNKGTYIIGHSDNLMFVIAAFCFYNKTAVSPFNFKNLVSKLCFEYCQTHETITEQNLTPSVYLGVHHHLENGR